MKAKETIALGAAGCPARAENGVSCRSRPWHLRRFARADGGVGANLADRSCEKS
jgi:hypothetical protein